MGSLFELAPSGVYLATVVTKRAVRSYRTFSPLPIEIGGLNLCSTFRYVTIPSR